ncbi:WhiB family transcriptional regulator [Actinoplanes sp. NPDC020271]|uniref:WhiB family transcriptional regulator n=1 Tax=Actinoplanes sp. NPDC020271 TaxID=3363896 RepID=UPI00379C63B5
MSLWNNAACVAISADLFAAAAKATPDQRSVLAAKAVCGECRARTSCLAWAMAADESGVWGGLDQNERRRLRRKSAPPAGPRR